jgi:hypothetical protein
MLRLHAAREVMRMSKYEEMAGAAAAAQTDWNQHRDRCLGYLKFLANGLITYAEIPPDQVTFLRWNGETGDDRKYSEAAEDDPYELMDAIALDEGDGYWHLGLRISLLHSGALLPRWVSFVLCAAEQDQKPMVKIGVNGKPIPINLNDTAQCNAFYETIVEGIKQCFRPTADSASQKATGFEVGP